MSLSCLYNKKVFKTFDSLHLVDEKMLWHATHIYTFTNTTLLLWDIQNKMKSNWNLNFGKISLLFIVLKKRIIMAPVFNSQMECILFFTTPSSGRKWPVLFSHIFQGLSGPMLSSVQLPSHVWLFATPWTAARQASLSITNSRSLLKTRSIESVMPSNHFILCHPLLLSPSIFPSIRVFSKS